MRRKKATITPKDKRRWIRQSFIVQGKPLPVIPVCYAFFSGDRCLYVGRTKNLRSRMNQHQWKFGYINGRRMPYIKEPVIIRAVVVDPLMQEIYEALLIQLLRPEMNHALNGPSRGYGAYES
jgi:excinuclease UvrABC nuclease subunit